VKGGEKGGQKKSQAAKKPKTHCARSAKPKAREKVHDSPAAQWGLSLGKGISEKPIETVQSRGGLRTLTIPRMTRTRLAQVTNRGWLKKGTERKVKGCFCSVEKNRSPYLLGALLDLMRSGSFPPTGGRESKRSQRECDPKPP